jgi:lipopolysaccharide biosynthesis regulator YciM
MVELVFLLLPIAAISGWLSARRYYKKKSSSNNNNVGPTYFEGLNYLLNEQPDKAIDVFIRLLEVNTETVETHLALASLFRRRGETERAIRIHQNLIARPTLTANQRNNALTELGLDYMNAGVLDRAESIFLELQQQSPPSKTALHQLLRIYQQQNNWLQAIEIAKQLYRGSDQNVARLIGQFYCELADMVVDTAPNVAKSHLKNALSYDPTCIRAMLLNADIAITQKNYANAQSELKKVVTKNPAFISEVLQKMHSCSQQSGKLAHFKQWLIELLKKDDSCSAKLVLADVIKQLDGIDAANNYLYTELAEHRSLPLLNKLLSFEQNPQQKLWPLLGDITNTVLSKKPIYSCSNCGFTGKTMHWHCPSCSEWQTIQPTESNITITSGVY